MDAETKGLVALLEERAAGYGALRQSSLTAIAIDRSIEAITNQAAEIERLNTRLETVPGWSEDADGIACRDDTIKLADERIARLTAEIERMTMGKK